jgi:thiol-disulfide isomerase/thioredoxin
MSKFIDFNGSGKTLDFLSKIKNMARSINTTTYIIIMLLILFTIIAYVYYYYNVLPKLKTAYKPNNEIISGGDNSSAELLFFFANWCPHCKTAKPIWEQLKNEYHNKPINGYNIVFTEIDCSEETNEVDQMMNKYKVEGYPTIKLIKDGQVIEYDAKPTKDALIQFLNTFL